MADGFIGLGDVTEPEDIAQDAYDYITGKIPGWVPEPGNLDTIIIESQSQETSIERSLAAQTSEEIFRTLGTKTLGVPSKDATRAVGNSTWTMVDNAGHTIKANTQITLTGLDGQPVAFQTVADVTVPNGSTATAPGEVLIESIAPGADTSGLSGDIELIETLAFVSQVTPPVVVGVTTGGDDAETDQEYRDRLALLLTLQAPRPILPDDFSLMARLYVPGVFRAVAIDGYKADTNEFNKERCVTVVGVDENGEPLAGGTKTDIDDLLQAHREVNFLVFVIDATYTEIDVTFTYEPLTGYDPTEVETRTVQAVTDYLSPANWGVPYGGPAYGWVNQLTVRRNELISLIDRVEGVDYVTDVQLAVHGDPLDVVDVTIDGPAALTRPGDIIKGP